MRASRRVLWACLGVLGWSSLALAAEAEALVERMIAAAKHLDYEGIFVYQRDGNLETVRVMHRGSREPELERLESLSGPARGVIRDGEKVTFRAMNDAAVQMAGPTPRVAPNFAISGSLAELAPSYLFELKPGLDRVAGRAAQVVHVRPRTGDRYAYRLWMDQETGLLLKSMILDAQDRPLEQEQFATVNIGVTLNDAAFSAPWATEDHSDRGARAGGGVDADSTSNGAGCKDHPCGADAGRGPGTPSADWNVGWLPGGFTRHVESPTGPSVGRGPTPHFVYSDGLATVAIFVERLQEDAVPLQGFSFVGAVSTFSRVSAGHQITVIGELPQATVRRIALSVASQSATGQQ